MSEVHAEEKVTLTAKVLQDANKMRAFGSLIGEKMNDSFKKMPLKKAHMLKVRKAVVSAQEILGPCVQDIWGRYLNSEAKHRPSYSFEDVPKDDRDALAEELKKFNDEVEIEGTYQKLLLTMEECKPLNIAELGLLEDFIEIVG